MKYFIQFEDEDLETARNAQNEFFDSIKTCITQANSCESKPNIKFFILDENNKVVYSSKTGCLE